MAMDTSQARSSQTQGKSPATHPATHQGTEFSGSSRDKGLTNHSFREKMAYYVERRLRSTPSPEESFTEDEIEINYPPKATQKFRGPATIRRENAFLWINPHTEPEETPDDHGVHVLVTCEEGEEDQGFLLVKATHM